MNQKFMTQRDINLAVLNIQEDERKRIARDLHDSSLQNLTYLVHRIELCSLLVDRDPLMAKAELDKVSRNLKSVICEIRSTIFDLRPIEFENIGFKDAIDRLLDEFNENNQFTIRRDIEEVSCENEVILMALYQIIHECVCNSIKHSEGTVINFFLHCYDSKCIIRVEDNGKGFSIQEISGRRDKHFGLSILRERVELLDGKVDITSKKNYGTRINIEIPLE